MKKLLTLLILACAAHLLGAAEPAPSAGWAAGVTAQPDFSEIRFVCTGLEADGYWAGCTGFMVRADRINDVSSSNRNGSALADTIPVR